LVVFITPWIVDDPTMNEREMQQYENTEFRGPDPDWTRYEKDAKEIDG